MRRRAGLVAVLLATVATGATAASLHDPALRFQTTRTPHFVLYFHQGEADLARRLGVIAEGTWQQLAARLGPAPPALTHVVIVDETELANGLSTPLPRDTVVITAVWPSGSEYIGNTDDWLRLVFAHEFTHIVHLDRSESWARIVRALFGRVPLAYPNLFLPLWQIEGIATFEESSITGEGRLHAGDFQQIVGGAARAGRPEPLDRVNGGLTDWPGGLAEYAYGLGFHEYLADNYGADTFRELADRTARRFPYTGSRVFRQIYGRSLGDLWRDYESSLEGTVSPAPDAKAGRPTRVTHHGFYVAGPRFTEGGIVYSVRTPHALPSLNRVGPGGGRSERLTTRYLGSTLGVGRDTAYFDQQEFRRNAGLYSDLYSIDLASGHVRQLTREARILDPDLAPGGRSLVAVHDRRGRRDLVLVPLNADGTAGAIAMLLSAPETQFNAPRWSRDGRFVAAERHRPGALSEVVVVDVASKRIASVIARPHARVVTPAWTPDGTHVIVALAPENAAFQLYEVPVDGRRWRQVTDVAGGALWPDLSPDGKVLVYVGYTADGFDLFTMPYSDLGTGDSEFGAESALGESPSGAGPPSTAESPQPADSRVPNPEFHPYSPWPTLLPTAWTPIVSGDRHSIRFGAATGGFDVLGYHAWSASATWLVTSPAGAPLPSEATPDWQVSYAYARWRPTFYVSASTDTSFFAGPPTEAGTTPTGTLRETEVQMGVLVPVRHVRASHTALAAVVNTNDDYTLPGGDVSLTRTAVRGGWETSTAHLFGYSISPERGVTAAATVEHADRATVSAQANAVTGDVRLYVPGLGNHHVLAVRAAAGTSSGDPIIRRAFHLGGAGPNSDPLDFGVNAISLLRGFPIDTFAGWRVALLNADYRFPLARLERGAGTWPIFVHTIHAAVFADAGHTWTRTFRLSDAKSDFGAELAMDLIAGYTLPFTAAAGIAYGRDGSSRVANGTTAYIRVGYAF